MTIRERPIEASSNLAAVGHLGRLTLEVAALDHRASAQGYRVTEPERRHFDTDALAEAGLAGPIVGRLRSEGSVMGPRGEVKLDDVSSTEPGHSFALVMDTRPCPGAVELARDVDLLLCESTFLDSERELADRYGHMTAADAGRLAAEANAKQLVLSHFSARYPDLSRFAQEAGRFHPKVQVAEDFDHIPLRPPAAPA